MKSISLIAGLSVLLAVLAIPSLADDKKDGDKEKGQGWVQLFNGKDLTGWKIHSKPSGRGGEIEEVLKKEKDGKVIGYDGKLKDSKDKDGKVKDGKVVALWRVEDGLLIGSGPASHLFSERGDYQNFSYRVEAMINDKGNSGQYFRTEFGPGFPKGYETQINATHKDPIRTGSIYPGPDNLKNIPELLVKDVAPHKPDEWFTQEVTVVGNHITVTVNGKKTVDWKDTKNTYQKGHFALQGHDPGTVVKFRKIEVKELPPSS